MHGFGYLSFSKCEKHICSYKAVCTFLKTCFRTTKFANLKEIEQNIYCADKRIVNGTLNKRQIYVGQCLITPQKQNIIRNLLEYIVPKLCITNSKKNFVELR